MSHAARSPRDGYILVAVLGVMLVLTGFMAAGSLLVRSALDAARVGDADVATSGLAQAGLELTAYQLFVIKAAPAAIDGRSIKIAGGTIKPRVADESAKADINASDPKLLQSIFEKAGMDAGDAHGLVAWIVELRGADRNPSSDATQSASPQSAGTAPDGAVAQPAMAQTSVTQTSVTQASTTQPGAVQPETKKKLRGFESVDQLRDFPDLTREDFRALAPMLTVYNPDGKIDVLTASRETLEAIPGLSKAEVEVILSRRASLSKDPDKKALDDLMGGIKEAQAYTKTKEGPAFALTIDATSRTGRKKTLHAVVAASKSQTDPYYVLDWWD